MVLSGMCDLIYQSIYLLMYLPTNSITSIMKCFRNFEQISYYPFWKPEIYNPNKAWVFATLTSYQCLTFVLQKRPCLRPIRRELQSKLNATTTKPQENSYILAKKLMKNREIPITPCSSWHWKLKKVQRVLTIQSSFSSIGLKYFQRIELFWWVLFEGWSISLFITI